MGRVSDILRTKGSNIYSIGSDASVYDAVKQMVDHNVGSLLVLDSDLPGGLIEGTGDLRHAQTLAFTTLVLFQMFHIFDVRSGIQSAFVNPFRNYWVQLSIGAALVLQIAAIYVPALQLALSTAPLGMRDWLLCLAAGSSILWLTELNKLLTRASIWRASKSHLVVTPL